MRTVRTKIYKFDELEDRAKAKAISDFRNKGIDTDYIYDEAHNSVEKFHEIFHTKEGSRSWLDVQTGHIDDNIVELRGLRLQKYLWNNFKNEIFKGKYYGELVYTFKDGTKIPISNEHPIGARHVKRYSKTILDNSCVLTGVCYDMDLLDPIYTYLNKTDFSNDTTTFESLIEDCFKSLEKSIENEVEGRESDESIKEDIENNEYEFTIDGNVFSQN